MKKVVACFMACLMLIGCCGGVLAVSDDMMRASVTVTYTQASASSGSNTGEVKIAYQVRASKTASPIGASSIAIYKSDGSYVTTIRGTTSNGFMANNTTSKSGTYTYKGTSGTSYYAKVTLSATAGSEHDSRTVTTNTARAK